MDHTAKQAMFEQLHTQYRPLLESTIWRLTANRDLFSEAYQNALLALWKHIDKLEQDQAGGYIYRIALSAVSKAWKHRPAKDSGFTPTVATQPQGPDKDLIRNEWQLELRQQILALPEKQGQAVIMRYLQDLSYPQIAKAWQCSESAVRAQVSRALTRLKDKMNPTSQGGQP